MSGCCFVMSACVSCGNPFSHNPHKVPSIRVTWRDGKPVPDKDGQREPVCMSCIEIANARRKAIGLEPLAVAEDAYEPIPEHEL